MNLLVVSPIYSLRMKNNQKINPGMVIGEMVACRVQNFRDCRNVIRKPASVSYPVSSKIKTNKKWKKISKDMRYL